MDLVIAIFAVALGIEPAPSNGAYYVAAFLAAGIALPFAWAAAHAARRIVKGA